MKATRAENAKPLQLNTAHGRNAKFETPRAVAKNTPDTVHGISTSVIVTESSMVRDRSTGWSLFLLKDSPCTSFTKK
ncbi:hypothetical protein FHX42_003507 [Saccharopolyspora lacisalsi]|uniref:Uncharacterized protein n=1 Tax=Halosaccharopolyspora lacisalsi TaxID=1000566 RepID=A0A839E440_9PSEU|nr:hypothetical protein [Halosaccharopolyspora lacisalsi]